MSAPNETPPGRRARRRRWWTGAGVGVAVLLVALAVLALLPRTASATASLTVTPRTEAGADAALLLADRYTALAGSTATLRTAREGTPALADVPLDDLAAGTRVTRVDGATIAVRVALPDRDTAAAAADAVVDTLVAQGSDEDLVDVDRGAEASASRAVRSPDVLRWSAVALLVAVACGLTAAALAGRGGRRTAAVPAAAVPVGGPAPVVDDLPGFLERPPGSVPALPVAPSAPVRAAAPVAPAAAPGATALLARHAATGATVTSVLVLVAAAVLVGTTGGDDGAAGPGRPVSAARPAATATATPGTAPPTTPAASAPAGETAAAALAFESVPLGPSGAAASVTFEGVVLEPRAVGLTVTYPSVSVTTDGRRALAHVRLPTFNCLTTEPPADPVAAGCAPSLTEYADLADPGLQVSRDGDRIDLAGRFATYTRPNGSAPTYTGREYQLSVAVTAAGAAAVAGVPVPATGVVRLGLDSAPTTADRGVNVLQLPG
jgi:hypothetical protein